MPVDRIDGSGADAYEHFVVRRHRRVDLSNLDDTG
jgi:hypothetical protein